MSLIKPPNIMTFIAATALVVIAILSKMGLVIPVASGNEIWLMFAANVLFILGCLTQGF